MKVFYDDTFTASDYAFDTTRKSKFVADRIAGIVEIAKPIGNFTDVTRSIHNNNYVTAVNTGEPLTLAESQGFCWDEGIPVMAQAHTDGLVSAMTEVTVGSSTRSGSLSSGLHHARFDHGEGFCTFNGLAAAALPYLMQGKNVLILDFDAHCGGGTWDILGDINNFTQVDVSVSSFDQYRINEDENARHQSRLVLTDPDKYLDDINESLEYAMATDWDLVIYNAGMDPFNLGVDANSLKQREEMVSSAIDETPAIFALAGGYTWGGVTMDEIAELHSYTVEAWA